MVLIYESVIFSTYVQKNARFFVRERAIGKGIKKTKKRAG